MEVELADLISNASEENQIGNQEGSWKAKRQVEPEDPFDRIGKYITLFFIMIFISMISLQQELLVTTIGRFIKLDKKLIIQIMQSILISLTSTFYVYYAI